MQQLHPNIEADHERSVLLCNNVLQKRAPHLFLHIEHILLAAAGINQYPERQGQVRVCGKILNHLRPAILEHIKIFLGQIGDQSTLLVLNVEEELHYIGASFERGNRLVVVALMGLCPLGGFAVLFIRHHLHVLGRQQTRRSRPN